MLEFQVSQRWMLDDFVAVQRATHIVVGPPLTKLRADLLQILDQVLEPGSPG